MIIVRLAGGMGNQMFQYAIGRKLSVMNNTTLGLDIHDLLDKTPRPGFTFRDYDLDLFSIQAEIIPQSKLSWRQRSWGKSVFLNKIRRALFVGHGKEKGFTFNPRILELGPDVYLDGYFQSHKYFESIASIIRKDFTLKNPLPENIRTLKIEIESRNSVCIHVRRGDYVGNSFHETVSKDYYDKAISLLSEKTKIEHVYVFSEDISWCRENLSFAQPTTFVGDEYAGERASGHFALMQACSHFIIPNSSFSWWAAWLAENSGKIVIAPKKWFGDESIDTSHRIPDEWIRI
jgi:hypothetical protein